jgi:excisionase family DNA binding protein
MNEQNNNDTIRTEPEGFITKETLAIRLSRTVRTVENWQRRGIIPYVKCGRCVLFKWTDVETHLQTHFRVCGQQNGHRNPNEHHRSSVNSVRSVSSVFKHTQPNPRRRPANPEL